MSKQDYTTARNLSLSDAASPKNHALAEAYLMQQCSAIAWQGFLQMTGQKQTNTNGQQGATA